MRYVGHDLFVTFFFLEMQEVSSEMRDIGAPAVPVVQKAQFHTILAM
jgi:hypothetical protein